MHRANMSASRFCAAVVVLLAGCVLQGPWGTCRTECKYPERRDVFCDCYDPTKNPPGSPPRDPGPAPQYTSYYFQWEESTNCALNRRYYIFNRSSHPMERYLSYRVRGEQDRRGTWVRINANATTLQAAKDIGLEEVEPDCFDQDFLFGAERDAGTRLQGAELVLKELGFKNYSIIRDKLQFPLFAKVTDNGESKKIRVPNGSIEQVTPLNCVALCNEDPPSAACYSIVADRGNPSFSKIRSAIYQPTPGQQYSWPFLLSPLIQANSTVECKREDAQEIVRSLKVINTGLECGYPFGSEPGQPNLASGIVRLPANLSARVNPGTGPGGATVISALSASDVPFLGFRQRFVHRSFGGQIISVTADQAALYYQTTAPACIALREAP